MIGPTTSPHNFQPPHELTPRDDVKKVASEILKRVDQLIKKGELDLAQMEIHRVKDVDPRNVYAFALEERISILKTEIERLKETKQNNKQTQSYAVKRNVESDHDASILSKPKQSTTIPAPFSTPRPDSITIARKYEEPQRESVLDRSIELESYKETLAEAWADGALTANEKRELSELRTLLEITEAEHEGIEKNVKRECYRNAIIQQLSNNPITSLGKKSLTDLQHAFQISEEEHLQIQTQLMDHIQKKQRNKILVIDDDTRLLELLTASLEDNGFDVTGLSTSDEAYALLRKFVPDLILCDINLETSTMGGFTFYEKIQELKHVQSIPFVFLTGLTDEALVRTGKELGVDDYLMKPISGQTLVSTIRGKIKRFKQLKNLAVTMTTV
jgi:CheY-like chemotaxis protein